MNHVQSAKIQIISKPGVIAWPGYVLFFMMLFLPVSQNSLHGILTAIVVVIIGFGILLKGGRVALSKTILLWTLFYVIMGAGYVLLGFLNDAPGALSSMLIYVISPLVFALFIAGLTSAGVMKVLLRLIVIATIAIGLAGLNLILWQMGFLPDALHLKIDLGQGISFLQGTSGMRFYSLASLVFTLPFLITSLIVYNKKNPPFIGRFWIWLALISGLIIALLGGREALLLVVVLTSPIALFLRSQLPEHFKTKDRTYRYTNLLLILVAIAGLVVYLSTVFDWTWGGLANAFLGSFDYQNNMSAQARYDQFYALIEGWMRHPFIGSGLGSYVHGVIRNPDKPWAYELQYVLLLFQTGLMGLLLYSSGIIWLYVMGLKVIRSGSPLSIHMVPVLVGTSCFLMANATNPYLQAYGQLWTLFFPIAMINIWLLSKGDCSDRYVTPVNEEVNPIK